MNCALCSSPIPPGSTECPACAAPISYSITGREILPDDEPIVQQPLSTWATPQTHTSQEVSWLPTPHTVPKQLSRSSRTSFIINKGVILVGIISVMILAGTGLFIYLAQGRNTHSTLLPVITQATSTAATRGQTNIASTPATISNPYPPYRGTLLINDPLQDNSAGSNWMDDTVQPNNENRGCRFTEGAYHIVNASMPQPYMVYCLALNTNFSNFVYQIQSTLLKGSKIGIVFRQVPGYRYYYFYIDQSGSYGLLWNNGDKSQFLTRGLSSAIHKELNQPNLLAVVANGNTLDLYVNKQHLASVTDNTFSAGRIGTAVQSDDGSASDAAFSDLMLWILD